MKFCREMSAHKSFDRSLLCATVKSDEFLSIFIEALIISSCRRFQLDERDRLKPLLLQ
jgi:hypothetical protein